MRLVTRAEFQSFISAKPFAAILFDAPWDRNGSAIRAAMLALESAFAEQAVFGEVDCDQEWDLAKSIPVLNVPLVAYYHRGQLVQALIGGDQNVRARLERVLRGEDIGYNDGTTAAG
jgi:thioredoxin-like negative regulator of GroEL